MDIMFGQDFSTLVHYPLQSEDPSDAFPYLPLGSPLSQSNSSSPDPMSSLDEYGSSISYFPDAPSPEGSWRSAGDYKGTILKDSFSPFNTPLYHQAHPLQTKSSMAPSRAATPVSRKLSNQIANTKTKGTKHSRQMSTSSRRSSPEAGSLESAPNKRRRTSPVVMPNGRPSGACTRCKKLKMKCTFDEGASNCARCTVNGHDCVVLGRKPRSPGLREVLRKQIREKDAMIDELLKQMNPTPSLTTPLTLIPSRLALTESQRSTYRDALSWLEKAHTGVKMDSKAKIDVSFLEDGSDSDMDSDDGQTPESDTRPPHEDAPQLNSLPGASAPAGLLAAAALESNQRGKSPLRISPHPEVLVDSQDLKIEGGIGSKTYFQPGPSANLDLRRLIIERQAAPDILLSGLVTYDDVGILFDLYFKWINPFIPVLDENIHTPAAVLGRCPFLFTVVCALASRYYDAKPEMYGVALHLAKAAAANAFLDGWKTIEMCQAYILLGAYIPPARRWEEDRYWFFTGLAFRLGIELNLNRMPSVIPTDERGEREFLNRMRTWIICYIMDRCICINLGKPFMVPEDEVIRNAAQKFLGFKYQHAGDGYLVSLVEVLRIIARFTETLAPLMDGRKDILSMGIDLGSMHKLVDDELTAWRNVAMERSEKEPNRGEPPHVMQTNLMHSVFQYCRLVLFSAGLQQVVKLGALKEDTIFFAGCLQASSAVLNLMIEGLIPTGFIRHCPEQVFALTAFATVILLKGLQPEFSAKIDHIQEDRIITLVKRLVTLLDADPDRLDDQRITRRYSRFVQHILDARVAELKYRKAKPKAGSPTSDHSVQPSTSAESPLPVKFAPPPTLMQPPVEHLTQIPNAWDELFANQSFGPASPFLGVDYMSVPTMADDDSLWLNNFGNLGGMLNGSF